MTLLTSKWLTVILWKMKPDCWQLPLQMYDVIVQVSIRELLSIKPNNIDGSNLLELVFIWNQFWAPIPNGYTPNTQFCHFFDELLGSSMTSGVFLFLFTGGGFKCSFSFCSNLSDGISAVFWLLLWWWGCMVAQLLVLCDSPAIDWRPVSP